MRRRSAGSVSTAITEAEYENLSQSHLKLLERVGFIFYVFLSLDVDRLEGRRLVVARSALEATIVGAELIP